MALVERNKEKGFLKKHVYAIHSSNNISLLQRKIYNAMLFNAAYLETDQRKHTINLNDLSSLIGYDSKDFKKLKKSIRDLTIIPIDWNVISETDIKEVIENTTAYLAGVQFKGNTCTYEYADILKEFLLKPAIYGKVYLKIQSQFKTSSGIALYENCSRYKDVGYTPWIQVGTLGKLLGFDDTKIEYKRIKERFINKAIKEVNDKSDLHVFLKESKVSRKVDKVKFIIEKNQRNTLDNILGATNVDESELKVINALAQHGFSNKDALDLVTEYGVVKIVKSIEYVINQNSYKEGKVRSVSGYILKTLRDEYKENISSSELVAIAKKQKEDEEVLQKRMKKQQDQAYASYYNNTLNVIKKSLGSELLDTIAEAFKKDYKENRPPIFSKWANEYMDGEFTNKAVNGQFNNYLIENHLPADIEFQSKEMFIKNI